MQCNLAKIITTPVVPKPNGPSIKDGEFGLSIYLLVGFLALLLDITSNAVLTAQPSNLLCYKLDSFSLWFVLSLFSSLSISQPPSPPLCFSTPPFYSSSLPFYSLLLVGTQMITSPPYPTWPPLLPRIPRKLAHSKDSLETCKRYQTTFGSGFPQGTNNVRLLTPYLTSESLIIPSLLFDIRPSLVQQLIAILEYWSYVHILRI